LRKKIQPNPGRRKSRKFLILLLKPIDIAITLKIIPLHLPHPAPSLPRNSRRFESNNALPKPDNRLPMMTRNLSDLRKKRNDYLSMALVFLFSRKTRSLLIVSDWSKKK
jgi:hypothetical protein